MYAVRRNNSLHPINKEKICKNWVYKRKLDLKWKIINKWYKCREMWNLKDMLAPHLQKKDMFVYIYK